MASLRGPGAMKGRNLVAVMYDNSWTKAVEGKQQTGFVDVQLDGRDSFARDAQGNPAQTNLHLVSQKMQGPDGGTRYNNGAPYASSQVDAMVAAAGDNKHPIADKDGNQIGMAYGFQADLMPSSNRRGLAVNTNTLKPSEFPIGPGTLTEQFRHMKAASAAQRTARETQVQAQVETPAPTQTAIEEVLVDQYSA